VSIRSIGDHGLLPDRRSAAVIVILDYEDDPSLVYREVRPESLYVEGQQEIEERRRVFQHLGATALGPNESIAFLRLLAEQNE
jgi:hypothetical protein